MKLARRPRIITTLIALISVLFTQLAVAAYVCPSVQVQQAVEAAAKAALAHERHTAQDCEDTGHEPLAVCHVQPQVATQSLDKPEPPQVSPFAAVAQPAAYSLVEPMQAFMPTMPFRLVPTRGTAPPLAIQHCCFRI